MFKIITFNANGIRSAARKGFFTWLAAQQADAVCVQETKAQQAQLTNDAQFFPLAHHFYHDASKKGYSGTALYLRPRPQRIITGRDLGAAAGWPSSVAADGRYLEAQFADFSLINLYLHSGSSSAQRQADKEAFWAQFAPWLTARVARGEKIILCGDLNIAHTAQDLKNWRANQNRPGFLPHERQWLSDLFAHHFADAFRLCNQNADEYTWWSNRSNARANNVGWRIDYQIVSRNLVPAVQTATIYRAENFSDHAPLILTYAL